MVEAIKGGGGAKVKATAREVVAMRNLLRGIAARLWRCSRWCWRMQDDNAIKVWWEACELHAVVELL